MKLSTEQQLRLQWTLMGMMHPQVCDTSRHRDAEQLCAKQSAGCVSQDSSGQVLHNNGLLCSIFKCKLSRRESSVAQQCSSSRSTCMLRQMHTFKFDKFTCSAVHRRTASVAMKGWQLCRHQLLT